jgi:branched-chain amino acid aminotransferase
MEKGFTQVLWLDAIERKYIEEVGTSNVFFLIGEELITPPLGGSILPGVTRNSVIQIARTWNIRVSERPISIDELLDSSANGSLKEAFASGTAAIVSPIGKISYKGKAITINNEETGALTKK